MYECKVKNSATSVITGHCSWCNILNKQCVGPRQIHVFCCEWRASEIYVKIHYSLLGCMKSLECKVLMWLNRSSEALTKAPPVQLLMHHFHTAAGSDTDLNFRSYDLWHWRCFEIKQWYSTKQFWFEFYRLLIKGHNQTLRACLCCENKWYKMNQRFGIFVCFWKKGGLWTPNGLCGFRSSS